jgi:hypothetical protein
MFQIKVLAKEIADFCLEIGEKEIVNFKFGRTKKVYAREVKHITYSPNRVKNYLLEHFDAFMNII